MGLAVGFATTNSCIITKTATSTTSDGFEEVLSMMSKYYELKTLRAGCTNTT